MQMWWRRRDVVIASRCKESTFILTGEDEEECIEGVETFKYLGRILERSNGDWPAVLWNVGKDHRVWNRLGKLLGQEGVEPQCLPCFIERWYSQYFFLGRRPGFCQRQCTGS